MAKKRVFLVDDNPVVRSMVRQMFDAHPDFEVVGAAENGRDAVEKAGFVKPDLIVMDLAMPVMTGLDAAPLLQRLLPDLRMILFTVHDGAEVERLARGAGIHAIVAKADGASRLIPQAQVLMRDQQRARAANDQ